MTSLLRRCHNYLPSSLNMPSELYAADAQLHDHSPTTACLLYPQALLLPSKEQVPQQRIGHCPGMANSDIQRQSSYKLVPTKLNASPQHHELNCRSANFYRHTPPPSGYHYHMLPSVAPPYLRYPTERKTKSRSLTLDEPRLALESNKKAVSPVRTTNS